MADKQFALQNYELDDEEGGLLPLPAIDNGDGNYLPGSAVVTSALPSGAATSAKQDTLLSELQLKADLTETQPVSAQTGYYSEVAMGNIAGRSGVNKFGAAPSGLQVTATDIWDRANASPTQQIWLAPTAARIHTIASTSGSDVTGGGGVNSVVVHYLPDWDTAEATETVTGDLSAGIAMNNAAVIIHRMKVIPQATTTNPGGNVGTITATAAVDGTITAVILPGNGQTEMAIYGVPSTQTALLHAWNAQIDKSQGTAASADFQIRVNENPDVQTVAFLRKDDISLQSTGVSSREKIFQPPNKFPGPCIIKVQGMATTADTDGEAGFDLELVTN